MGCLFAKETWVTQLREKYGIQCISQSSGIFREWDNLMEIFDCCLLQLLGDPVKCDLHFLSKESGMAVAELQEALDTFKSYKNYGFQGRALLMQMFRWGGIEPDLARFLCSTVGDTEEVPFAVAMRIYSIFDRGTSAEKLAFLFSLFDVDGSGSLSYEEVQGIVSLAAGEYLPPAQVVTVVDELFLRCDSNNDGDIHFEEFMENYPFVSELLQLDREREEPSQQSPRLLSMEVSSPLTSQSTKPLFALDPPSVKISDPESDNCSDNSEFPDDDSQKKAQAVVDAFRGSPLRKAVGRLLGTVRKDDASPARKQNSDPELKDKKSSKARARMRSSMGATASFRRRASQTLCEDILTEKAKSVRRRMTTLRVITEKPVVGGGAVSLAQIVSDTAWEMGRRDSGASSENNMQPLSPSCRGGLPGMELMDNNSIILSSPQFASPMSDIKPLARQGRESYSWNISCKDAFSVTSSRRSSMDIAERISRSDSGGRPLEVSAEPSPTRTHFDFGRSATPTSSPRRKSSSTCHPFAPMECSVVVNMSTPTTEVQSPLHPLPTERGPSFTERSRPLVVLDMH